MRICGHPLNKRAPATTHLVFHADIDAVVEVQNGQDLSIESLCTHLIGDLVDRIAVVH